MNPALDGAVELLEHSLAYTRTTLGDVDDSPSGLRAPTPCAGWDLRTLLAHLDDALDAFTGAASGVVDLQPVQRAARPALALRDRASTLLGAWVTSRPPGTQVAVGGVPLGAPLLVATAALELAVHGWDVAQATGADHRIPDDLAGGLLAVAHGVVGEDDRVTRFAPPVAVRGGVGADRRLLAWLGRTPYVDAGRSAAV